MNSMHNSFGGSGGYPGPYPGYVPPPSALPYYNGYPGDLSQVSSPYYGKPTAVPPGYSSGMGSYSAPPINNSSMYYQQYGLGYQYGYSKYGLGSGLGSNLGYSSELAGSSGITPPSLGGLQAPTTDLGLTGSMFSKGKFSGNQGSPSPLTPGIVGHGSSSSLLSPVTSTPPSPGPHSIPSSLGATGATPSPPADMIESKKDLDKMRRCQICGQVFRLMSECLAHMKSVHAVHDAPISMYSLQHGAGGHLTQSLTSTASSVPSALTSSLGPNNTRTGGVGAPDSPLMALERMGWGEKQGLLPSLHASPSPLTPAYTPAPPGTPGPQHLSSQHLSSQHSSPHPPSQHPASQHPTSRLPSSPHSLSQNPPSQLTAPQQSSNQHPPTQHSSAQHPSSLQPSSQHPTNQLHGQHLSSPLTPSSHLQSPQTPPTSLAMMEANLSEHHAVRSRLNSLPISYTVRSEPQVSQTRPSFPNPTSSVADNISSASEVQPNLGMTANYIKPKKASSYSVSSIIGETSERTRETGVMTPTESSNSILGNSPSQKQPMSPALRQQLTESYEQEPNTEPTHDASTSVSSSDPVSTDMSLQEEKCKDVSNDEESMPTQKEIEESVGIKAPESSEEPADSEDQEKQEKEVFEDAGERPEDLSQIAEHSSPPPTPNPSPLPSSQETFSSQDKEVKENTGTLKVNDELSELDQAQQEKEDKEVGQNSPLNSSSGIKGEDDSNALAKSDSNEVVKPTENQESSLVMKEECPQTDSTALTVKEDSHPQEKSNESPPPDSNVDENQGQALMNQQDQQSSSTLQESQSQVPQEQLSQQDPSQSPQQQSPAPPQQQSPAQPQQQSPSQPQQQSPAQPQQQSPAQPQLSQASQPTQQSTPQQQPPTLPQHQQTLPQQQQQKMPQPMGQQPPPQQGYPGWAGYQGPSGQYPYGYTPGNPSQSAAGGNTHPHSPMTAHKSSNYHPMQNTYGGPYGNASSANYPSELSNRRPPGQQGYPQSHWYGGGGGSIDSKSGWNMWNNQGQHQSNFPQPYSPYPYSGLQQQKMQSQQAHPLSSQKQPPSAQGTTSSPQVKGQSGQVMPSQQTVMRPQTSHTPQPPVQGSSQSTTSISQHLQQMQLPHMQSHPHPLVLPAQGSRGSTPQPSQLSRNQSGDDVNQSRVSSPDKSNVDGDELKMSQKQAEWFNSSNSNDSLPSNNSLPKKPVYKIGPKSKTMAAKQYSQIDDLDNYRCTITVLENGSLNGYGAGSNYSSVNSNSHSYDSSDSEMASDEKSTFVQLRPVKRRKSQSREGVFIGPKRIKQARMVKERQERRHRQLEEQLRQTELEEQIQASRVERSREEDGPLGNMLVQSSILLADSQMEEQDNVDQCIASIKAHQLSLNSSDGTVDLENIDKSLNGSGQPLGKRVKKTHTSKTFHNENSVIVKTDPASLELKKLRAKDFKWSHFIKSMRYWCNDCAHGFKNQKEATSHSEDQCKLNCLYMLECYVIVKDVQAHPLFGPKVQELLEEYQIDGQHKCKKCGEIIARKADFLVHCDSHKDFMPWECTICGTRFKIRGSLKEHLRYTHMKGRVPCLKCNKVFPTSTLLRQHVKVHTQHYKYKSTKNRDEELKAAMVATEGALEPPPEVLDEEAEKLSDEANEYRNWCKLMELNAMKNIGAQSSSSPEEKKKNGTSS